MVTPALRAGRGRFTPAVFRPRHPARPAAAGPRRTVVLAALGTLLAVTALAACGSGSGSGGSAGAPAAAATSYPTAIPAGTKLRVGDQNQLKPSLDLSGESSATPYTLSWSTFASGPLLLEAFRAGAVDVGYVADTPPVLAAASGQDLAVIATWHNPPGQLVLATKPGSDIHSVADLKGKKVAITTGTILQAYLLRSLDAAHLAQKDVSPVNLAITDISSALARGDVDAGVVPEPLASTYLSANPTAHKVTGADPSPITQYLITTHKVLADPAKAAALGDFVARWVKAAGWRDGHTAEFIQKYYVDQQKVPAATAKVLVGTGVPSAFVPIDATSVGAAQKLADLFFSSGVLPKKVDISKVFDARYNAAVKEAQQ
ncbi:aliphatic sulfonate ABC transporter substrate-binding protein [Frankia sp. AgB1.9]|uniref:aliphatic sulfonate ABC transporter substrate-binding protein n=1 Tax=unclassified Frankia TaxID=2632575 RepID=UPI0019324ED2|nr:MULTISPECIES: aliphatic sulfonate ABC transporter substrate-binding protein [unclassified Frankia]MBL7494070.1 aliphatic sulfonate ABC transporter substrate-binding protein [Frankia sp. AgW1.1]MBL7549352.1 aliphatic sulfonate ABC transporter substrate-binding protein [Frankia sp. AgB1.9]MBL7617832.1 aliphatic sulfonate ABC transporter substrate-binding protein [Frankia sp. AgB1.8]